MITLSLLPPIFQNPSAKCGLKSKLSLLLISKLEVNWLVYSPPVNLWAPIHGVSTDVLLWPFDFLFWLVIKEPPTTAMWPEFLEICARFAAYKSGQNQFKLSSDSVRARQLARNIEMTFDQFDWPSYTENYFPLWLSLPSLLGPKPLLSQEAASANLHAKNPFGTSQSGSSSVSFPSETLTYGAVWSSDDHVNDWFSVFDLFIIDCLLPSELISRLLLERQCPLFLLLQLPRHHIPCPHRFLVSTDRLVNTLLPNHYYYYLHRACLDCLPCAWSTHHRS